MVQQQYKSAQRWTVTVMRWIRQDSLLFPAEFTIIINCVVVLVYLRDGDIVKFGQVQNAVGGGEGFLVH